MCIDYTGYITQTCNSCTATIQAICAGRHHQLQTERFCWGQFLLLTFSAIGN